MAVPRGIRNNNPGNIEKSATPWQGKVQGTDPRFETFDTPLNGIRALAKNIMAKKGRARNIRELITIWAPPSENDTEAYIRMVAAHTGIGSNVAIDLTNATVLNKLTAAIIQHENGQQPYAPDLIAKAVRLAGGVPDTVGVTKPVVQPLPPFTSGEQPKKVNMDETKSIFGGKIASLIPQVAKIFLAGTPYAALADTVVQTVVEATGAVNEQQAVQIITDDPAALQKATEAVLTQPDVAALLEVGGGIPAARTADVAATQAERSFLWSPAFWISLVLLSMPFMLLADVFYVHADKYSGELRTQVVTAVLLIISMVGAFYLGSSQGSQKKDEMAARAAK